MLQALLFCDMDQYEARPTSQACRFAGSKPCLALHLISCRCYTYITTLQKHAGGMHSKAHDAARGLSTVSVMS